MAKQRLKRIQAGRLVREVLYTASFPSDTEKARAEKTKFSTQARQKLNDKTSWEKLKMVLAENFSYSDLFVTLTYDDDHLPATRDAANKQLKAFFAALRAYRRARGQELIYVKGYTEDKHGDGRLHHHFVVNGTKEDYDVIRSLWTGGTDINIEPIDAWGYEELAKYMTKEAREGGRSRVGERSWTCSHGIRRPMPQPTEWVNADVRLEAPPNAREIRTESIHNEWGSFSYFSGLEQRILTEERQ